MGNDALLNDMKVISQQKETNSDELSKYIYGEGVDVESMVYTVDCGAVLQHRVSNTSILPLCWKFHNWSKFFTHF